MTERDQDKIKEIKLNFKKAEIINYPDANFLLSLINKLDINNTAHKMVAKAQDATIEILQAENKDLKQSREANIELGNISAKKWNDLAKAHIEKLRNLRDENKGFREALEEMKMIHICKKHGVIKSSSVVMDQDGTFYCNLNNERCWEINRFQNPIAREVLNKHNKEIPPTPTPTDGEPLRKK